MFSFFDSRSVVLFLLFLNTIIPLIVIARFRVAKWRLVVDHLVLFSIGFICYWVFPIFIGMFELMNSHPSMELWYNLFRGLGDIVIAEYLTIALVFYLAFVLGTLLAENNFPFLGAQREDMPFDSRFLVIFLVLGVCYHLLIMYLLKDELFQGYIDDFYVESNSRGTYAASSLFLLVVALCWNINPERAQGMPLRRFVANWYFLAHFCSALLILSLGGRMYFMHTVAALVVYRTLYYRSISLLGIITPVLILVAGMVAIVYWRMSIDVETDLTSIGFYATSEFTFTGFSLLGFLNAERIELLNFPVYLFSGITNLLPSELFPDKIDWIRNPEDDGYIIYAPHGALNSFVSFVINFGVLGTFMVIFLFSYGLQYLKSKRNISLLRVMYIMLCVFVPFSFFREPFYMSIIKEMLQFGVIVPIIIFLCLSTFTSRRV